MTLVLQCIIINVFRAKESGVLSVKKKKVVKIVVWSAVGVLVAGYFGLGAYQRANYLPSVRAGTVGLQDLDAYLSTSATISSPDSMTYYAPPNSKVLAVHYKVGDSVNAGDMIAEFDLTDLDNQIRLAQLTLSDRQLDANNGQLHISDAQTALQQAMKDAERQPEIDKINAEVQGYQDEIAAYEARIRKLHREDEYPDGVTSGSGYQLDEEDWQDEQRWQGRIEQYTREIARLQAQLSAYPKAEDMQRAVDKAENAVTNAQNALSSAKNAQETAAINLRSLQRYQKDKGIVAQQNGVITELSLVEGALSTNTAAALTMQSDENLTAKFSISKYDVGTIKLGQTVALSLGDLSYTGTVSKIGGVAVLKESTSGGTASAQVPAEVTIDNPDDQLIIGIDFDMDIHTFSKKGVLALPIEALLTDRDGDFCYILTPAPQREGAYAWEKRYITVGKSSDTFTEILTGVSENELVVMNPPATIEQTPLVLLEASTDGSGADAAGTATADATATESAPADSAASTSDGTVAALAPEGTSSASASESSSSAPEASHVEASAASAAESGSSSAASAS